MTEKSVEFKMNQKEPIYKLAIPKPKIVTSGEITE